MQQINLKIKDHHIFVLLLFQGHPVVGLCMIGGSNWLANF